MGTNEQKLEKIDIIEDKVDIVEKSQPKKVVKSSTNATLSNVEQKNVSKEANSYDILMRAIELNVDLDAFEKLVNLVEKVQIDKAKKEFYEAFSKFQSQVPPILKSSEVNMGAGRPRYNYASLYDIISKIQKPLGDNHLSYRWDVKNDDVMIEVTCILSHKGGYELQTSIAAPRDSSPGKSTVQAIASTITYLKRYTLISLLGIGTADPDDDAVSTIPENQKTTNNKEDKSVLLAEIKDKLDHCNDEETVKKIWSKYQKYSNDADVLNLFTEWRKKQAKKVEDAKKVEQKVRTSKIIDRKEDDSDELQL
jgi:hypothetical protein